MSGRTSETAFVIPMGWSAVAWTGGMPAAVEPALQYARLRRSGIHRPPMVIGFLPRLFLPVCRGDSDVG